MANSESVLLQLQAIIAARATANESESYVASLTRAKVDKVLQKIGEEAVELIIAAKDDDDKAVIYESADLIFHLLVFLQHRSISLEEILVELQRRFGISGLAEKAQRNNLKTLD